MKTEILFFNGWAMDNHAISHLADPHYHVHIYSPHETEIREPETDYILVAWSMGVWAANRYLRSCQHAPKLNIAINGTPFGIHPEYGIDPILFQKTYEHLTPEGMKKIYHRIFYTAEQKDYHDLLPSLSFETQKNSLAYLLKQADSTDNSITQDLLSHPQAWDYAWVSEKDSMFATKQQLNYWHRCPSTQTNVINAAHHLLRSFSSWSAFIEEHQA
ncbi:pimeloyl-ACP methyl esterase BioG family protein [Basilea psittacipulmonis]|uniref:pimeloyl-ACP methyl esterase BioG family protein n=1 Tax=Basilea psittacipulmonis TaxID=1472345 RepID=UPI000690CE9C|nr:pimeloyl-ACP methyl esterase BioG family protein [Basilea psittacipulmonis]